jgi:hypothetical protein
MVYTKKRSQAIQVAQQGVITEHLKYNLQILKEHCKFQNKLGQCQNRWKMLNNPYLPL